MQDRSDIDSLKYFISKGIRNTTGKVLRSRLSSEETIDLLMWLCDELKTQINLVVDLIKQRLYRSNVGIPPDEYQMWARHSFSDSYLEVNRRTLSEITEKSGDSSSESLNDKF